MEETGNVTVLVLSRAATTERAPNMNDLKMADDVPEGSAPGDTNSRSCSMAESRLLSAPIHPIDARVLLPRQSIR